MNIPQNDTLIITPEDINVVIKHLTIRRKYTLSGITTKTDFLTSRKLRVIREALWIISDSLEYEFTKDLDPTRIPIRSVDITGVIEILEYTMFESVLEYESYCKVKAGMLLLYDFIE